MDEAMKKELMRLCEPVAAFMQKNCTPHDAVIVTDVQVRMVSDEFSVPVSECGRRRAASGTDGQSGLWTEQQGTGGTVLRSHDTDRLLHCGTEHK